MKEIKCPHCQKTFTPSVDEYNDIVAQIRKDEFEKELQTRLKEKMEAVEIAKNAEIERSNNKLETQIAELKNQLEKERLQHVQEVKDAVAKVNENVKVLEANLKAEKDKRESDIQLAIADQEKKALELKHKIDEEIRKRELELAKRDEKEKDALASKEREILELRNKIDNANKDLQLQEKQLKDRYELELKLKDDQIAQYKDFKIKLSTKMVGESLERYCSEQFENLRPTAFQNAYFSKDNEVVDGGKGDFIFRDYAPDGVEYISIMFEMKNENEGTQVKHKNEDFFEKLHKDRVKHGCEYAVLVSMLELENEYYNQGIVDISFKAGHEKMYAIRPQNFIALITLLRNAAMKNVQIKSELELYKKQNVDVTNFEDELEEFKSKFANNMKDATDRFDDAIDFIDKTINNLNKVKENLQKSAGHLGKANNKLDDLTVKKLTRGNPTMKAKFDEAREAKAIEAKDDSGNN